MPSGAKKRKAAKKKKGLVDADVSQNKDHPTSATAHSNGEDDLKNHDERESDGGEVSSPASQDNQNHQRQFDEEDAGKREASPQDSASINGQNSMGGVKSDVMVTKEAVAEEEVTIQVDREMKLDDESESKIVTIEHNELPRESREGSLSRTSSSSSSSSDDSRAANDVSNIDTIKVVDSLSEVVSPVIDKADHSVEKEISYSSNPDKALVSEESPEVDKSALTDDLTTSVAESMKEQVEAKSDLRAGTSEAVVDLVMEKKDSNVIVVSDEKAEPSFDAKNSLELPNDDKPILSHDAPKLAANNEAQNLKEPEAAECSDGQPSVATAPPPLQATSWKSCCGLFEVFAGSNR